MLIRIFTPDYVMFLPANQGAQAKLQKKLKPELKGAKVEEYPHPVGLQVEMGKLYRQDALERGVLTPAKTGRMVDQDTIRLMSDRTEFLARLRSLRAFMEEKNLQAVMPFSHKKILEILKENA